MNEYLEVSVKDLFLMEVLKASDNFYKEKLGFTFSEFMILQMKE